MRYKRYCNFSKKQYHKDSQCTYPNRTSVADTSANDAASPTAPPPLLPSPLPSVVVSSMLPSVVDPSVVVSSMLPSVVDPSVVVASAVESGVDSSPGVEVASLAPSVEPSVVLSVNSKGRKSQKARGTLETRYCSLKTD